MQEALLSKLSGWTKNIRHYIVNILSKGFKLLRTTWAFIKSIILSSQNLLDHYTILWSLSLKGKFLQDLQISSLLTSFAFDQLSKCFCWLIAKGAESCTAMRCPLQAGSTKMAWGHSRRQSVLVDRWRRITSHVNRYRLQTTLFTWACLSDNRKK